MHQEISSNHNKVWKCKIRILMCQIFYLVILMHTVHMAVMLQRRWTFWTICRHDLQYGR